MTLAKMVKTLLLCGLVLAAVTWLESISQPPASAFFDSSPGIPKASNPEDYVGSDACQACHEDQFKAFSHTSHAKLATISSWKNNVTCC